MDPCPIIGPFELEDRPETLPAHETRSADRERDRSGPRVLVHDPPRSREPRATREHLPGIIDDARSGTGIGPPRQSPTILADRERNDTRSANRSDPIDLIAEWITDHERCPSQRTTPNRIDSASPEHFGRSHFEPHARPSVEISE